MSLLLALPSLLGALLSLGVAFALWRKQPGPAWRYGTAFGLAVAWWCAGQTAWFLVGNVPARLPIAMAQYVGICLASPLWLMTALAYVGRRQWLRPRRRLLFFIIPVLTIVAAMTNESHHLLWVRFVVGPLQTEISYGSLFLVHVVYSYSVAALGSVIMAVRLASSPHYRWQFFMLLLAVGTVVAMNLLYLTRRVAMPLDPTPAAFALSFAAFGWALARHHFLQLLPMARGITFETLRDGLIVVDAAGRIVDMNAAVEGLLDAPDSALGASLAKAIPTLDVTALTQDGAVELRTGSGKWLEARRSRIGATGDAVEGAVVILRDVTAERTAQEELIRAQEKLREANQELERLAHTDALTGLANRRDLLAHVDEEMSRARRHGRPISFVMMDVDHFKRVNDAHGHAAGDRVLRGVGRRLLAQVRPGDRAGRLGGEEFGVLLPDTSLDEAYDVAQRLREALRAATPAAAGDLDLRVTMSFGVATLRSTDPTGEALMERADRALYQTKREGRDGITREAAEGFERLP